MASFSVRKLDDQVYESLKMRAAYHGISMEEEVRQIIYQAVSMPKRISEVFKSNFGYKNGIDLDLSDHRKGHNPMDFDE